MALFVLMLKKVEHSLFFSLKQQHVALCQNSLVKYGSFAPERNSEEPTKKSFTFNRKAAFLCIGAGSVWFLFGGQQKKYFSTPPPVSLHGASAYILDKVPPVPEKLAASYKNPKDNTGLKITLYQFTTCPFCCKVRAFLNFYGFSYDIVEVNSVTRTQTKWTKYRKVPFLVVEEESSGNVYQLKDSSLIISTLASYVSDKQSLKFILEYYPTSEEEDENKKKRQIIRNKYAIMYPKFPKDRTKADIMKEREWRRWVDDDLVHVLSPNVYRTFDESKQAFSWFAEAGKWNELFPKWELPLVHYVGSTAMYLIAKRLKKRHNLKDDVRLALYDSSNMWLDGIKEKQTKFMGGDQANLSDVSVYGVLTAIEGCDAFNDLLQNTKIRQWFENMKDVTANRLGSHHVENYRA